MNEIRPGLPSRFVAMIECIGKPLNIVSAVCEDEAMPAVETGLQVGKYFCKLNLKIAVLILALVGWSVLP